MASHIDTKKVAARRTLRFQTIDEIHAELDRCLAAEQAGRLKQLGNWTLGQTCAHLAAWIEYAYVGFPMRPVPAPIRWLLRWQLRGMLKKGMPAGVMIPGVAGGTTGADPISAAEGVARYHAALDRLRREPAVHASPAFGKLTEAERLQLNLRHAELHLSFLQPG